MREIKTYQEILAPNRLGTAHFYGAVVRPDEDLYWLFLEKISGLRLCQVRDDSAWLQAARWLAHLHFRFCGRKRDPEPVRPPAALRCRVLPAVARASRDVSIRRAQAGRLGIPGRHLWSGRRTADPAPIHLDPWGVLCFNILVQETREGCRIRPVDWEMAAVGPGLIDLAALTSGAWTERERTEMAAAYHDALLSEGMARLPIR